MISGQVDVGSWRIGTISHFVSLFAPAEWAHWHLFLGGKPAVYWFPPCCKACHLCSFVFFVVFIHLNFLIEKEPFCL